MTFGAPEKGLLAGRPSSRYGSGERASLAERDWTSFDAPQEAPHDAPLPTRSAARPCARSKLVRAAASPTGTVDATPVAVSPVLWLNPARGSSAADGRNGTVGWAGKANDRTSAIRAGRALADAVAGRRALTFRAAACLTSTNQNERLRVDIKSASASAACSVSRADTGTVAHEAVLCNAEDAAADAYPYADVLTLSFTAEEDAVFEKNRAFYKGCGRSARPAPWLADLLLQILR